MDVAHNILGGLQSEMLRSVLSMFLSVLLYITYSIMDYSTTNVPSKLLLPSYDFIVVGGGSAGMFSMMSIQSYILNEIKIRERSTYL
jgi:hypothetical protein